MNNCLGDGVTAAIVSHLCDLKGEPDDDNGTDCNGVDDGCLDEKKSKVMATQFTRDESPNLVNCFGVDLYFTSDLFIE